MKGFASIIENLSTEKFIFFLCTANFMMYGLSAAITKVLRLYFIRFNLNHGKHHLNRRDYILSLQVLLTNILVGLIGWAFLKAGYIQLATKDLLGFAFDIFLLFSFIDIGMYFSHLIIHKTFLYKFTHKIHHEHESMTLISLYVMHPLEALGFGILLIIILIFYPVDTLALLIFLFLNWVFGVFAHSGIEPSKGELANYICMTRFHQIHHENPTSNFGFYTPFMDMIFKTRAYLLKKEIKDKIKGEI